jgi:hypothetical protein
VIKKEETTHNHLFADEFVASRRDSGLIFQTHHAQGFLGGHVIAMFLPAYVESTEHDVKCRIVQGAYSQLVHGPRAHLISIVRLKADGLIASACVEIG